MPAFPLLQRAWNRLRASVAPIGTGMDRVICSSARTSSQDSAEHTDR